MTLQKRENDQKRIILWLILGTIGITAAVLGLQFWQSWKTGSPRDQNASSRAGVTPGKAAMIEDVQSLNPDLSFDSLSALSAGELEQLYEAGAPGLPIGLSFAGQAAEEYAGTLEMDSVTADAEAKLLENPACYTVELHHVALGDFKYKIAAYTGEVLEGRPDILRDEYVPSAEAGDGDVPEEAEEESLIPLVGEEAAKDAALRMFEVPEDGAEDLQVEADWNDGNRIYRVTFHSGRGEYSCVLDAATGRALWSEEYWHAGE